MTQKEKLIKAKLFVSSMERLAERMLHEGNDYDMQWHRSYCREIKEKCEQMKTVL